MKDGTRDEYLFLRSRAHQHEALTAQRIMRELQSQDNDSYTGYQVTRVGHARQSATRAYREGADADWIVAALLHDIGDGLAPQNHEEFAAAVLRPFVREEVAWTVQHHGAFQLIYYGHHFGWNQFEREKYAGHIYYQSCVDFCERWDQSSFDPDYQTESLAFFEPMVMSVFSRKAYDPEILLPGKVMGLPGIIKDAAESKQPALQQ